MNVVKKLLLALAALVALCVLLVGGLMVWKAYDEPGVISVLGFNKTDGLVGQSAPDFTLPRLGGGELSLSELRGRRVMLFFWATWCPSCDEMKPIIADFQREHGGFEVVTVTFRENAALDDAAVERAIEDKMKGQAWTHLRGGAQVADDYRLKAIPNLVVVDEGGRIVYTGIGKHTPKMLQDALAAR